LFPLKVVALEKQVKQKKKRKVKRDKKKLIKEEKKEKTLD
jgi:hypothetical protein